MSASPAKMCLWWGYIHWPFSCCCQCWQIKGWLVWARNVLGQPIIPKHTQVMSSPKSCLSHSTKNYHLGAHKILWDPVWWHGTQISWYCISWHSRSDLGIAILDLMIYYKTQRDQVGEATRNTLQHPSEHALMPQEIVMHIVGISATNPGCP